MLSQQTISIIKSTAPVLEVCGTEITTTFYKSLFNAHPELLNMFNHANQQQGKQQAALANAVYAAAIHIDRLEAILPVVRQIAQKHRSLGVQPEHYPIVGQHLLGAIKTVLGDAATDEIIEAWGEAYGVIANAFIGIERDLEVQAAEQSGGWNDFRAFRVERKVRESEVITSFYLMPVNGQPIAEFTSGQYVSVKITIPGEPYTHIRQYSLSDAPGKPYYRISVKREEALEERPAGKISNHLHKQIEEGSVLWLSAPAGNFILESGDTKPVVLISGGVGLTPMVSMLNTLAETEPDRQVTFIHAAHNEQVHAMREHVEKLVSDHTQLSAYWCYAAPLGDPATYHKTGYLDLPWLKSVIPSKEASFYFCGPTPFMRAINGMLKEWDVPDTAIHYEFFGPADAL